LKEFKEYLINNVISVSISNILGTRSSNDGPGAMNETFKFRVIFLLLLLLSPPKMRVNFNVCNKDNQNVGNATVRDYISSLRNDFTLSSLILI
jgi:hypothetical protein